MVLQRLESVVLRAHELLRNREVKQSGRVGVHVLAFDFEELNFAVSVFVNVELSLAGVALRTDDILGRVVLNSQRMFRHPRKLVAVASQERRLLLSVLCFQFSPQLFERRHELKRVLSKLFQLFLIHTVAAGDLLL